MENRNEDDSLHGYFSTRSQEEIRRRETALALTIQVMPYVDAHGNADEFLHIVERIYDFLIK